MPTPTATTRKSPATLNRPLEISLPKPGDRLDQDEEWVIVQTPDGERKIRLHDYDDVYSIPGLYERWVYDMFQCTSPAKIRELLFRGLKDENVSPSSLTVLDLGAGNGCVAEELQQIGIDNFIGVDIYKEARDAAHRDRPGLYDEYIVGDMTNLPDDARDLLAKLRPNCLTCVAALGFGDIPPEVFLAAYNEIVDGGWIAFTIKEDFLNPEDQSGFSKLIRTMLSDGALDLVSRESYVHRVSTDGQELIYEAFIGRKRSGFNLSG